MRFIRKDIVNNFGNVNVKTCAYCKGTILAEFFYEIPPSINLDLSFYTMFSSQKKRKQINEGICLKCLLKGLLKISQNDKQKVEEYLNKFIKGDILEKL